MRGDTDLSLPRVTTGHHSAQQQRQTRPLAAHRRATATSPTRLRLATSRAACLFVCAACVAATAAAPQAHAWNEWTWRLPSDAPVVIEPDDPGSGSGSGSGSGVGGDSGGGGGFEFDDEPDAVDPGPRMGHSWELFDGSVFLFGGRANDITVPHTPRTYEIVTVNGSLVFASYDQKLVNPPCNITDPDCDTLQNIGLYFNDVWEYPINCTRWSDTSCAYEGWKVLNSGAILGGCEITGVVESCTHPTERFDHMTAMFSDGTMMVYGGFSHRCEDYCSDMWAFNVRECKVAGRNELDLRCQWDQIAELGNSRATPRGRWRASVVTEGLNMYLFGGQRMWHGFGTTNSVENRWTDLSTFPEGGYMNDLWMYDFETRTWEETEPVETCFHSPGESWEERNDFTCVVFWPDERAGGKMVKTGTTLLMHGGYRTFFPYPHSNARGAGSGTAALSSDGFSPYPTYPFYMDDMWQYNFTDGIWGEVVPVSPNKPAARVMHSLVLFQDVLYLFGGYRSNFYFGDLWMYNITTQRWLLKVSQVHAVYPPNCTDDTFMLNGVEQTLPGGGSVFGQPTRGSELDFMYGRAPGDVFIQQPRRQAPGWDGCRDRADGRLDLPAALMYEQPMQRGGHQAIFAPDFRLMLMYGGRALTAEQSFGLDLTHESSVRGDLWQMHVDHCPKNCSLHGRCYFGYCYCDNGYYGVDCSNVSCPGDFCWYDTTQHLQHCRHCCHAPHPHADGELFIEDQRKVPCDHDHIGESHGICDGFGACQCRPPYLGTDCSIRDCPNNCTFNGWCDVQYPNSRCMCDPGWEGVDCSERICLNNCSYPNGYCDAGVCVCAQTYNPYNKTVKWKKYAGTDCSYGACRAVALLVLVECAKCAVPQWGVSCACAACAVCAVCEEDV